MRIRKCHVDCRQEISWLIGFQGFAGRGLYASAETWCCPLGQFCASLQALAY